MYCNCHRRYRRVGWENSSDARNDCESWKYLIDGWAGRCESPARIIVFDYPISRSGKHAQNFLSNWQSSLAIDDYAGYKPL